MARLHSIREVKFVKPFVGADGKGDYRDPRGYAVEIVTDPMLIEHYAEGFRRSLVKCQEQVERCAVVGHDDPVSGCGGKTRGIAWSSNRLNNCELWLESVQRDQQTPERTMLVRITVPIDDQRLETKE